MTSSLRSHCKSLSVLFLWVLSASSLWSQKPVANFDATPLVGCAPLTVYFNDKSSNDVIDWEWDVNNDGVYDYLGDPLPTHTYANPGTYSVRLTVVSFADSSTVTKTKYIVVLDPINVVVPTQRVCALDSFILKANVTGGLKPYHYFWSCSNPPAGSLDAEPKVAVDTTQTWTLDIIDSLSCTGSTSFVIETLALPTKPSIIRNLNVLTSSQTAISYQWLHDGSLINGATSKTYVVDTLSLKTGYIQVRIKNAAGCTSTSDSINLATLSDVTDNDNNSGWTLYPNPTNEIAYLSPPIPMSSILDCTLFSPLGEALDRARTDERSGRIRLSLADLAQGVYLLRVTEPGGSHVFRIVKE